jgi:hypothetical protein
MVLPGDELTVELRHIGMRDGNIVVIETGMNFKLKLERGFATIPLSGIDALFHSHYLWDGVLPFRACMLTFSHHVVPF